MLDIMPLDGYEFHEPMLDLTALDYMEYREYWLLYSTARYSRCCNVGIDTVAYNRHKPSMHKWYCYECMEEVDFLSATYEVKALQKLS